jgi:hypothetical protein
MRLQVQTAPQVEPITTSEAVVFCRLDDDVAVKYGPILPTLIASARAAAEQELGPRAHHPDDRRLPRPVPVRQLCRSAARRLRDPPAAAAVGHVDHLHRHGRRFADPRYEPVRRLRVDRHGALPHRAQLRQRLAQHAAGERCGARALPGRLRRFGRHRARVRPKLDAAAHQGALRQSRPHRDRHQSPGGDAFAVRGPHARP